MKGHLDTADLEKYKKADLQDLATKLGVSSEGTVKEIAARCATVEVDIPEESEKPEEETVEAETVEAEEEKPEEKAAGNIKVIQTYDDKQLKRIVEAGETLDVSKERAALLISLKLAKTTE